MFATEQHVFIHFMNFPAILVQVHFYPHPHPPPTHPPVKQWKKFFSMDLSISWNFLQFWFRCISPPPPHPPPTHPPTGQTVKKKFFSWIYPFHEISCNFGSGVFFTPSPPPTSQTVKTKFFPWIYPFHEISCNFGSGVFFTPHPHTPPTHQSNSGKIFFFMDLSISWNFLLIWLLPADMLRSGINSLLVVLSVLSFNISVELSLLCREMEA